MNIHPQVITKNETPEFIVLPYKEYRILIHTAKEQENIKEIEEFRTGDQQTIPLKLLQNIAEGEHPVRTFREFRELSQIKLANAAGITRQYLCQIENKQRKGNIQVLKKIADILKIDLDLLVTQ